MRVQTKGGEVMGKRRVIVKQRSRWTAHEWEEGWDDAMCLLDGAPTCVEREPIFQDCLAVLNGAFGDGDRQQFELGLSALIDFCAEAVSRGECEQWWS
jgi:hypothetical protein